MTQIISSAVASTVTSQQASAYPSGVPDPRVAHCFVEVGGARLHLLDFGGTGRPTLLLHGVGGNAWTWLAVAPALTGIGRTLALDFRGYGESQWSPSREYSTASHAADALRILQDLGVDEIDVVGFSWGGLVGLVLAGQGAIVRRLAIVDIPPSFEASETAIPELAYDFADAAGALEAERRLSPRAAEKTVRAYAALSTRPADGGRLVKKHDETFLHRWPFRSDDHWDALARLERPLLVIRAANSPVLDAETARSMVAVAPTAALVEIADCGHMIPLERPEALAAALGAFLS